MSTAELINTGMLMGIIHVITGPDHLSALATLCGTNIRRSGRREATRLNFLLGVRWGLGHSVGLMFVGGILIAAEEGLDNEWIGINPVISMMLEGFVGLFMLALGTYGIVRANRNKMERVLPRNVSNLSLYSTGGEKSLNSRDHEMDGFAAGIFGGQGLNDTLVSRMEGILDTRSGSGNILICDDSFLSIDSSRTVESEGATRSNSFVTVTSQNQPRIVDSEGANRTNSFVTVTLHNQRRTSRESSSLQQEQPRLTPSDATSVVTMLTKQSLSPSPQETQCQTPRNKPQSNLLSATSLMTKHTHNSPIFADDEGVSCCGKVGLRFLRCNPGHLAIATGILHGVAGPGGILGVIPAVQMQDAWNASVYLVTFCLTSTFVMGGFAAFYGSLSRWLAGSDGRIGDDRVYVVEIGSALLSLCVGFVWLTLLSFGKLDDVFP